VRKQIGWTTIVCLDLIEGISDGCNLNVTMAQLQGTIQSTDNKHGSNQYLSQNGNSSY